MKCPNDGAVLTMSERSGVEIDYCPECRGVWLDRGELDKILDRAAAESPAAPPPAAPPAGGLPAAALPGLTRRLLAGQLSQGGYQQGGYQKHGRRPKKKEHWLSELFD